MLLSLALLVTQSSVQSFDVDGVRREALVFTGKGPGPHPLVLAFHGHGGNMRQASRSFRAHEHWPEATVVYPQGLPTKGTYDPQGAKPGWQQKAGDDGDRDLRFVDAILASIKDVDRKRTFAMGHSNGGRFTYVLWGSRGDNFAAYGPSGSPAIGMIRRFKPASVFATAGETDRLVPYAGQRMTIQALARLNGADLASGTKNGYVTLAKGRDGLEVGTYIHPGGHEYPSEAARATVELFKRVRRGPGTSLQPCPSKSSCRVPSLPA
ncbi:esterase [bacterium]|nr:MAG: esterase [bacterium]